MSGSGCWIFGYGSLVSPVSFGVTLGRALTNGVDFHYAVLNEWGRRWNYGAGHATAELPGSGERYSLVALGIVAAPGETANGVIGWVTADELRRLDAREAGYDRIDVSDLVETAAELGAPVEVYVPTGESVARYEAFRDAGTGAIEQRYWDLVAGAFAGFGVAERRRYLASTPPPDVPILELVRPDPYR